MMVVSMGRRRWPSPSGLGPGLLLLLALAVPAAHGAGAIASARPEATRAGHAILAAGGNAFDAAVAVAATLAVVEPFGSGLGGGGFFLLHRQQDGHQVMVDGRETAPAAAHPDLYVDADGEVVPGASVDGPLAAGIPGLPAALVHLSEDYGRLPLARVLEPAIQWAEEGFEVSAHYRAMASFRKHVLNDYAASAAIFLDAGEVPGEGALIRQPDLAATLRRLGAEGRGGFYDGEVAAALVDGVVDHGGIWSAADLAAYRVRERAPVVSRLGDIRVVSASPPSSGGVALATMVHMLEDLPLGDLSEADAVHYMVEAMRFAYRDRAVYLGDPDYTAVPVARLTSPAYAHRLARQLSPGQRAHIPSPDFPPQPAGTHTTHFSIMDDAGNRVAATLSINYPFGSGFVAAGTGVLLNDEMDDFVAKPGVPNVYGLVGGRANAVEPGKRPLSSMSPTFVEGPDRIGVLGTPGGSRIITMVLLGALDFARGNGPASWVARPRFHHQFLPDVVQFEPGAIAPDVQRELEARGHRLQALDSTYGNMQAVMRERRSGRFSAASDPRGEGLAEVR